MQAINETIAKGPTRQRNAAIDCIKFVAMVMVLGLHQQFGRPDKCLSTQVIASLSGIAIPMFFMVNGYLMTTRKIDYRYVGRKIFHILRFIFFMSIIYWIFFSIKFHEVLPVTFPIESYLDCFIEKGRMSMFWFFGAMIILYLLMPIVNSLVDKYRNFLPSALLTLFVILSIIFVLNIKYQIEIGIPQTFRIWNWLFFFLLGSALRRYGKDIRIKLSPWAVGVLAIVYVWFIDETYPEVGSRGSYFGSAVCMVYALLLFVFILQKFPNDNARLKDLTVKASKLFLPVYALHSIYFQIYYGHINTSFMLEFSPIFDFIVHVTILTVGCYWLMKIPYMNKIFRI